MSNHVPALPLTRLAAVALLRRTLRAVLPQLPPAGRETAGEALLATTYLQTPASGMLLPTRPWAWAFRKQGETTLSAWQLVHDEEQACRFMLQRDEAGQPVYECEPLFTPGQLAQPARAASTVVEPAGAEVFTRAIVLDFDGVTHPLGLQVEGRLSASGKPYARPVVVDYFCWLPILETLLAKHPDVGLVVLSSWREGRTDDELRTLLGRLGGRYMGKTIDGDKVASIEHWRAANPHIRAYLVLDDALEGKLGDELLPCHWQRGLSDPIVQRELAAWLHATR